MGTFGVFRISAVHDHGENDSASVIEQLMFVSRFIALCKALNFAPLHRCKTCLFDEHYSPRICFPIHLGETSRA